MKNVLQCTAIHLVECTAKLENVLQNVLLCTAILKKKLSGHPGINVPVSDYSS